MPRTKFWGYAYKEPPPTLLIFYHDRQVAELEEDPKGYVFRYLPEFRHMNLTPFPGLPADQSESFFYQLPTYFQERLPDLRRPEIREYMLRNEISADSKLQLLAELSSHTVTDPFEFRLKIAA
jgi:hypothetical protein